MTNRQKRAEYAKAYRLKNIEYFRTYKREWTRKWRENPENKDKEREKQRIAYRKNPTKTNTEAIAKWRLNNPEKVKAQRAVFCALRRGDIQREPCEHCPPYNWKVEAHHPDYSKPLEIVWLCKIHHRLADRKRRELSTS